MKEKEIQYNYHLTLEMKLYKSRQRRAVILTAILYKVGLSSARKETDAYLQQDSAIKS